MKPKNYIKVKTRRLKDAILQTAKTVKPVYRSVTMHFENLVQQKPKSTLAILLLVATVNFIILLLVVNHNEHPTISMGYQKTKMDLLNKNGDIDFSFSNYFKIKALKDSLETIVHKQNLSHEDSLLFVRIYEQYSKIDPTFFNQLNKYSNEKNTNHH